MLRLLILFLVLNIYAIFSVHILSQEFAVIFTSSAAEEQSVIDSILVTTQFSSFKTYETEKEALKTQLLQSGYYNLSFGPLQQKNDSVYKQPMTLGQPFKTIAVHVTADPLVNSLIRKGGIKVQNDSIRIPAKNVRAYLSSLSQRAAKEGYSFSQVALREILPINDSTLGARLHFEAKRKRTVDAIQIKGYEKFPKGFVKHRLFPSKSEALNPNELSAQNEALNLLPFVSTTREPEILFKSDSTTVYYYLQKENANQFDGFIGFSTNEDSNELQLDGYLDLVLLNNLNFGEELRLNYKNDGSNQSQLNVSLHIPYLFKTPLGIQARLGLFRSDSLFSESTQKIEVLYQLKNQLTLSSGYQFKASENLTDSPNTVPTDILQDFTSQYVTLGASYIKRSKVNLFRNKFSAQLTLATGNRTTTNQQSNQYSGAFDANYLFRINTNNYIYLNSSSALLQSADYLSNELFRFGGITSIRGFEENSIFANQYSVLNTEYRYLLGSSIYIHSIVDLGIYENKVSQIDNSLTAIGLGVALLTKSGLFKINIANGKTQGQSFEFANMKIHFKMELRF